ncbi:DUF4326 domain-containing protein [Streptomyces lavendofoliae]|uniref:DUF4326 domain-containing protein n=1 Tax=Streptomyces lavendofoliae TaxID=67314 RepID=A0A918M6U4_9ACTN|nr:DUF4326 domain-containing protein [Streptomyces lavendofoliae]GGU62445.1 hypothetical protein GCM10010274_59040 [Streptomyces lavendofoliae]
MATYQFEFGALGDSRPVPPLTVQTTDPDTLSRAVVEHARPHITPILTEMGRPELADCLFRMNRDRSMGQFLWLDLAGGKSAEFLPSRITTTPERIQRKRTAGWTANGARYVGRGTRWGNPFTITDCLEAGLAESKDEARKVVTDQYRQWLVGELDGGPGPVGTSWSRERRDWIRSDLDELRGRDLMCWCPLVDTDGNPVPCHADVLLELCHTTQES